MDRFDDGDDAYFVTGLRTFTDVNLVDESELEKALSVSANVPAGSVAALAGGLPGAQVLDSAVAAGSLRTMRVQENSNIPGERIYAVSARKISFRRFSRDELKDAAVSKDNLWISTMTTRGKKEGEETVEADFDEKGEGFMGASESIPFDGGDEVFLVLGK
jgi:hypothetical protein